MNINELIQTRRSIFADQFVADKKVPDAIIHKMIENATYAPNHGKAQPWYFTVFTGEGLQQLADFQSELYKKESGDNFKEITYQKLKSNPLKASHIIGIGMKKTPNPNIPEMEDIAAVSCAVQNMALTAHANGVGGFWSTGGITFYDSAKPFFNLEAADRFLGFFYIGYVAHENAAAPRKPLSDTVRWVS